MRQAKHQPLDNDLVALQAARDHYAPEMQEVMVAMRTLLAGRHPCQLIGRECVAHLTLRARFNELAMAQRDFAEAHLARRLARILAA